MTHDPPFKPGGLVPAPGTIKVDEPQLLRSFFMFPESHAHLSDESLQAVIDGAKQWIGRIRWSWQVVACNYLRDGRYHG